MRGNIHLLEVHVGDVGEAGLEGLLHWSPQRRHRSCMMIYCTGLPWYWLDDLRSWPSLSYAVSHRLMVSYCHACSLCHHADIMPLGDSIYKIPESLSCKWDVICVWTRPSKIPSTFLPAHIKFCKRVAIVAPWIDTWDRQRVSIVFFVFALGTCLRSHFHSPFSSRPS